MHDGALEATAQWERELILRYGLSDYRSGAIDRVLLRLRNNSLDFTHRGTQILSLLEDVKESVSNYALLECLLRIVAVGEEVGWEYRRRVTPIEA